MTISFRVRRGAGFLATTLTLVALGLSGPLAGRVDAAPDTGTPFAATLAGKVTVGVGTFTFVGGGTSEPLGQVTNQGVARATGVSLACLVGLRNTNVETLTTSDGSTLTLRSQDLGCLSGLGIFHGLGHWTVTGATGRLAGTTGSGTLEGRVNLLTGTFTMVAKGTLIAS